MQLIQISVPQQPKTVSVRQMFEQLAQREAKMIRESRERVANQLRCNA